MRIPAVTHPPSRNTIFSESARVLAHEALPGSQFLLRLQTPRIAAQARPGAFVHLQCHPELPMRRPMSIMRADTGAGSIEILYKVHGAGTARLAQRQPGEMIEMLGPIGVPFKLQDYRRFPLLIGGGVGIPPMVFLAEHIRKTHAECHPLVLMGSEIPFPFRARPSRIMISGIPPGVIATMPLLEDWGIPCRLASLHGYAGCYEGFVTGLAKHWLDALAPERHRVVELFCCGPTAMLEAASRLAQVYALPCQVSMEEYMACAVGGCAGCTIPVATDSGPAMLRVCVDGPVFDGACVFPPP